MNVTLSPHNGLPGMAHSSAARAAVENLTRVLSIEWARFGIKLTALAAGHFATETLMTKYPKPVVEGVAGTVPLQRLGTAEEFAWLVAYLASPAGDYFSGAVLTIDGGARQLVRRLAARAARRRRGQAARRRAPERALSIPEVTTERLLMRGAARGRPRRLGGPPRRLRGDALARARPRARPRRGLARAGLPARPLGPARASGSGCSRSGDTGELVGRAGLYMPRAGRGSRWAGRWPARSGATASPPRPGAPRSTGPSPSSAPDHVISLIAPGNDRSRRVAERLGRPGRRTAIRGHEVTYTGTPDRRLAARGSGARSVIGRTAPGHRAQPDASTGRPSYVNIPPN